MTNYLFTGAIFAVAVSLSFNAEAQSISSRGQQSGIKCLQCDVIGGGKNQAPLPEAREPSEREINRAEGWCNIISDAESFKNRTRVSRELACGG